MADVALVFPYFDDGRSKSFKFPPLGIGYISSFLKRHGYSVKIIDCTFRKMDEVVREAATSRVVGIYSMLSMVDTAKEIARRVREHCDLLVAGGPMPSAYPTKFLDIFDVVVQGEGEYTMLELMEAVDDKGSIEGVKGLYLGRRLLERIEGVSSANGGLYYTGQRPLVKNLDLLGTPDRDSYDNDLYKQYYRKNFGYTMTSMVASRGCPFSCSFCWRPDYGRIYRVRSPENIVDEMEEIRYKYKYERIWFADELFIANKKHVIRLCEEIISRRLEVLWECLARADLIDSEIARYMRRAGCHKIIFGLEAGDDRTLNLMNKRLTVQQSRRAVKTVVENGIKAGGFFILGYPGETNETMLKTIKLASSLPLDYFSMTIPYPLPGTRLYEQVRDRMISDEWEKPSSGYDHRLLFKHDFSLEKLKYGMWKAVTQSRLRKKLGPFYALVKPWEWYTDYRFKKMS
ncbi:2-hydroxyethylphosphonate methyltransferase [archaeon HR01]|nr:2-hydroxyethylphosphonate methyltransferase [archaeon HR01]